LLLELDGYTLYCPVWSPAGKIYFLAAKEPSEFSDEFGGSLWSCDTTGKDAHLLVDGLFGYLAISTDGSKLALTCGYLIKDGLYEGGPLIIVDSSGNFIDSIHTFEPQVVSMQFSYDGNKLYYFAHRDWTDPNDDSCGFYSINIDSSDEEFLEKKNYPHFFNVTPGGTIICLSGITQGDICPSDSNLLVWGIIPQSGEQKLDFLVLFDLGKWEEEVLNAKPYECSAVYFPYWAPNGDKIVFVAAEAKELEWNLGPGILWVYKMINNDIEGVKR
jgi:hypothetical protein